MRYSLLTTSLTISAISAGLCWLHPAVVSGQTQGAAPAAATIDVAQAALVTGAIKKGRRLIDAGNYQAAKVVFDKSLLKNPQSLSARIGLSRSLYGLGQYKQAL